MKDATDSGEDENGPSDVTEDMISSDEENDLDWNPNHSALYRMKKKSFEEEVEEK